MKNLLTFLKIIQLKDNFKKKFLFYQKKKKIITKNIKKI